MNDISKQIELVELYRDMAASAVAENLKQLLSGLLAMEIADKSRLSEEVKAIAEQTEGAINDLGGDLIWRLQCTVEESENGEI